MRRKIVALLFIALFLVAPVFADVDWVSGKVLGNVVHDEIDYPYVTSLISGSRSNRGLVYPATLEFAVEYSESEYHPLNYNIYIYGALKSMIPAQLGLESCVDVVISNDNGDECTLKVDRRAIGNRIHFNEMQSYVLTAMMLESDYVHMKIDNGIDNYVFDINTRNFGRTVNSFMKSRIGKSFNLNQLHRSNVVIEPVIYSVEPVEVAVKEVQPAKKPVQVVVPVQTVTEEVAVVPAAEYSAVPAEPEYEAEVPNVNIVYEDPLDIVEYIEPNLVITANIHDLGLGISVFPDIDFFFQLGGLSLDCSYFGNKNGASAEVAYKYMEKAHLVEASASYLRKTSRMTYWGFGSTMEVVFGEAGHVGYRFGGRISTNATYSWGHFLFKWGFSGSIVSPVVLGNLESEKFKDWETRVGFTTGIGVCF